PHPPLLHVATDSLGPHYPRDALVVHALAGRGAVVELGSDPGRAAGLVLLVCGPDPFSQRRVRDRPGLTPGSGLDPRVVGRALDLDELTQSLHLEGGGVVGNELEATHQFVSPAKYLAARWRISRSVESLVVSTSSSRTRARSRASSCSGVSGPSGGGVPPGLVRRGIVVPSSAVFLAVPYWSTQCFWVPRATPKSAAMPFSVAPWVDSYKSTA